MLRNVIRATRPHFELSRHSRQLSQLRSEKLHVLYDGSCPLCVKEIALLQKLKAAHMLEWVDISEDGFRPATFGKDVSLDSLMAEMHVFDPADGTRMYTRMAAFRRMYAELGLGWLWSWTGVWPMSIAADRGYTAFANNRHKLAAWMR